MSAPASTRHDDFDFLTGAWAVTNRRLKQRHVGADDWDEFPGSMTCRPLLGGVANVDEIVFPTKGFSGATVRTFDRASAQWSLYWINSATGGLFPPVHGRFEDGRGEFLGDDEDDGRPVKVRFVWSDVTPVSARWEQAFSIDGGRTWEVNWVMEFSRTGFQ
ncbi:hypothetical protein [Caulobacter sp. 17J65-9]|uniref:hypothetical protein n=1 Tax=Caulobacter sp. 17J65-9 TaxID=2709382 RepID=UPI0013C7FFB7|nr:hypothetical protein [Caulobacter sp. 17J65-9]NEX91999.1 hypothetical protein [Caulobacter sp. 17J65-9]